MFQEKLDNLNNAQKAGTESCSVCRDLLTHLEHFFDMLETARKSPASDWLTVDDIAKELKISKSIVYRLIRHGELKAVILLKLMARLPKKAITGLNDQILIITLSPKK